MMVAFFPLIVWAVKQDLQNHALVSPVFCFTLNAGHGFTEVGGFFQLCQRGLLREGKDIDFTSAKKLKENHDNKIDSFLKAERTNNVRRNSLVNSIPSAEKVSAAEMHNIYKKLNQWETKAAMLSFIDPYADQFISKSRNVPVVSDFYDPSNLDLEYPELLRKCLNIKINLTEM